VFFRVLHLTRNRDLNIVTFRCHILYKVHDRNTQCGEHQSIRLHVHYHYPFILNMVLGSTLNLTKLLFMHKPIGPQQNSNYFTRYACRNFYYIAHKQWMPITLPTPFIPTHGKHRLWCQDIRVLVSVTQRLKQMTKLGMDPYHYWQHELCN
jgi:hypothetical protein